MTLLTLSDSSKLISTLVNEQETLYNYSKSITQLQAETHRKFLLDMQRLSNEQEGVLKKLADVDKMLAMAYSERSCLIY